MAKVKAPNRNEFELDKVKIIKGGGMEIDHVVMLSEGSSTEKEPRNHKKMTIPHPDFVDALADLKEYLCKSVGMFDMQTAINSDNHEQEERRAAKTLKKVMEQFINHRLSMVQVTGMSLSGEDKTEGVVITGTYTTPTKAAIAINSPRIMFNRDVFGWESELAEKCQKICDESYEYIYDGKKGQATMLDNENFEGNQGEMYADNASEEGTEAPSVENLEKNLSKKNEVKPKKKAPAPAKKKTETKLSKQSGKKKKK